ncbi:MAG: hypothetical protein LBW85_07975, partial [Deltaproteobacteria bacterium]|nr:hypothetical protein [Deltaproteobacteria bacterium]
MKVQKVPSKKRGLKPGRGYCGDHKLTISSLLRTFLNKQGKFQREISLLRPGSHFNLLFARIPCGPPRFHLTTRAFCLMNRATLHML